ncbi:aminoglycoside phosphotransferase family protein [Waterburya agarophytonicola K14]|uniref:Aminoglycoside phosphotransferase family protein n=1 Tax=Waterburya agarophytonicola KI4 TaxID=2874699 RepID=A0A964BM24_9CYAN|nr:aminoglycoside phosphotransferase family protein [Waterburya agarophytonicola]MCC0175554.1 aminoglycoside phosphotransferase family protein [Waterburya agarophytonicola KI4]
MVFSLSSHNVWQYLQARNICSSTEISPSAIKPKDCKNFNLLVSFSDNCHYLVKQECWDTQGKTKGEFQQEWLIQRLVRHFPQLNCLQNVISEAIDYDRDNSIIVFNYLNNYCDLANFYDQHQIFPTAIATALGETLATIHRLTFKQNNYRDFLAKDSNYNLQKQPNLLKYLSRIKPELIGKVGEDAFKFYRLYQREVVIGEAIAQLEKKWLPCCLTHRDFRLANILVSLSCQAALNEAELISLSKRKDEAIIRIIDWERFSWGDPAFDLGTIIANYLKLWLGSLIVGTDIDIRTTLSLATTPLAFIQPSLVALTNSYLAAFPEITHHNSDFLTKAIQFAGYHLIELILAKIEYREPFDNTGICLLQIAKMLLCHPQESMMTVFGQEMNNEELART